MEGVLHLGQTHWEYKNVTESASGGAIHSLGLKAGIGLSSTLPCFVETEANHRGVVGAREPGVQRAGSDRRFASFISHMPAGTD